MAGTTGTVSFNVNTGAGAFPQNGGILVFGSDYAHSDFVTTMARFEFYNAEGKERTDAPAIFIRMGGPFQTGLASSYSEASNIFGTPGKADFSKESMLKLLKGGADAIYKQIANAGAGAAGFIGSAGLSGKAQYEFATRTALNKFNQLIYDGPTFRRFSLPFTMKPTSQVEAETMIKIIKTFRLSAAAKGAQTDGMAKINTIAAEGDNIIKTADLKGDDLVAAQKANAEAAKTNLNSEDLKNLGFGEAAGVEGMVVSSNIISFGYPDMCLFQILIKSASSSANSIASIFESALCVIENVQIDYGSQNKMVFFDPTPPPSSASGLSGLGVVYYPAEVTLTIGLREATLTTAGSITQEQNNGNLTIF